MNWQRRLQRKLQWVREANHWYLPTVCEGEDKEECLPGTFSQVARARLESQTVGAPDSERAYGCLAWEGTRWDWWFGLLIGHNTLWRHLNLIGVDTVSRCDALVGLIHKLLGKDTQIKLLSESLCCTFVRVWVFCELLLVERANEPRFSGSWWQVSHTETLIIMEKD